MHSPFPGMDPYLEGHLWPDVHHGLVYTIKEQLVPLVSPNYVVRTETYIVKDTSPEEDTGIIYPDVDILKRKKQVKEPEEEYLSTSAVAATPPTVTVSSIQSIEVRIPVLEIRDRENNQLITAIEILSPVNKRKPGLEPYREKRQHLYESGVHLIEIDLIRRGTRPFQYPNAPKSHYWITLVRAGSERTDIWALNVQDSLPNVPVPLNSPDTDRILNLGTALQQLYERSRYDLSINYEEDPPPPAFSEEDRAWMRDMLSKRREELKK